MTEEIKSLTVIESCDTIFRLTFTLEQFKVMLPETSENEVVLQLPLAGMLLHFIGGHNSS